MARKNQGIIWEWGNDTGGKLPGRRLVSVRAACAYGCFSVATCYRMIEAGRIRAYKFGFRTLVDLNSLDELLTPIEPKARLTATNTRLASKQSVGIDVGIEQNRPGKTKLFK